MILEVIMLFGLFHHKKDHSDEWIAQRKYLDRAAMGIRQYEDDTRYSQYERVPLDAFEAQFQKAWGERNTNPDLFIKDMKILDGLGGVLDSIDRDLQREHVI